jgi:hypothetical protein
LVAVSLRMAWATSYRTHYGVAEAARLVAGDDMLGVDAALIGKRSFALGEGYFFARIHAVFMALIVASTPST